MGFRCEDLDEWLRGSWPYVKSRIEGFEMQFKGSEAVESWIQQLFDEDLSGTGPVMANSASKKGPWSIHFPFRGPEVSRIRWPGARRLGSELKSGAFQPLMPWMCSRGAREASKRG